MNCKENFVPSVSNCKVLKCKVINGNPCDLWYPVTDLLLAFGFFIVASLHVLYQVPVQKCNSTGIGRFAFSWSSEGEVCATYRHELLYKYCTVDERERENGRHARARRLMTDVQ